MEVENSLSRDQVLSRYMSFAKFASLLQTNKLFFPALSLLTDDPHEGSSTLLDEANQTGLFDRLAVFANVDTLVLGTGAESLEQASTRAALIAKASQDRFVETVFRKILITREHNHKHIMRSQRRWLDVSCWHAGADESLAMWRIYGGLGESVCICTEVGRLADSLQLGTSMRGYIGRVQYIDHQTGHFKADHPLTPALHKRKPFSFEQEVRALVWDPSINPLHQREGASGSLVDINLSGMVSRVRVSPTAPDWYFSVVEHLSAIALPRVKVERSGLDDPPLFEPNRCS